MNSSVLVGRLTAAPELKHTQNGVAVCSFTLAVKRPYKKDVTDFIDCVAWRNTAEYIANYGDRGRMLSISGSITTRSYEDKNGNKRKAVEVSVDYAVFNDSRTDKTDDAENDTSEQPEDDSQFESVPVTDDDLPY